MKQLLILLLIFTNGAYSMNPGEKGSNPKNQKMAFPRPTQSQGEPSFSPGYGPRTSQPKIKFKDEPDVKEIPKEGKGKPVQKRY